VRQGGTSERQEAIRRAEARIAGAEDLLPARKEPSKYPKGQGMGESWTTPEGLILTRDAQGNVKKIGESRTQPTYQDRIKAWNLALEANQNSETGKFDMEAVKALYAQIMGSSGGGGMQLDPSAALGHQAPAAGASVLGQFATDEQGPVAPGEQASAARQPLPILGADQARALSQFVAGKPAMLTADQTRAKVPEAMKPRKKLLSQIKSYHAKGLGYPESDTQVVIKAFQAFDAARAANDPVAQTKAWETIKLMKNRYSKPASKALPYNDSSYEVDLTPTGAF